METLKCKRCEYILKDIGNNSTRIKIENDIKGNYYSHLNDTIYLNNKEKADIEELIILCHECRHSIQDKKLHLINMIASNLEILLFIIIIILEITNIRCNILFVFYILSFLICISVRTHLETDAIKNSFYMAKQYAQENQINKLKEKSKKHVWIQFFNIYIFKVIRLIIVISLLMI